jgi:hypothetical protein
MIDSFVALLNPNTHSFSINLGNLAETLVKVIENDKNHMDGYLGCFAGIGLGCIGYSFFYGLFKALDFM